MNVTWAQGGRRKKSYRPVGPGAGAGVGDRGETDGKEGTYGKTPRAKSGVRGGDKHVLQGSTASLLKNSGAGCLLA